MGTSVESTLDHPLLGTGDSNNGADAFGSDGVVKLCLCQLLEQALRCFASQCGLGSSANLIVVVIGNKTVLGINQNPAELRRRFRGAVDNSLSDTGARKSVYKANV